MIGKCAFPNFCLKNVKKMEVGISPKNFLMGARNQTGPLRLTAEKKIKRGT